MYKRKTAVVWAAGIVMIGIGLFWCIFGNLHLSNLFGATEYFYDWGQIAEQGVPYGLHLADDAWEAETADSYFTLRLPRTIRIQSFSIDLESASDESSMAQIYYSQNEQMRGDRYWEIRLHQGENTVQVADHVRVRYLRFDLTDESGEQFLLHGIKITAAREQQLEYYIFAPLLALLYMVISAIAINRRYAAERIPRDTAQIISLAVNDFRGRFSGSYLGIFWGILQPLSTILLFWFVFQVGFRSNPVDDVPFILWLAAGMVPWNFFYDAWFSGTGTFTAYGYIVKKVVFRIEVLPLVRILSSSILNLIFNGLLVVIYCLYGHFMGLHIFDMVYFSFCIFMLTLGLSYVTATLNVFIKDIGQFMGIFLQILMWMTPLMWAYDMIPEDSRMALLYKLNPLHYVLNGYRESLINGRWFFYHWVQMLWFWGVTLTVFFCGRKLMYRMKEHFADVL